jgi:hypothetical protein
LGETGPIDLFSRRNAQWTVEDPGMPPENGNEAIPEPETDKGSEIRCVCPAEALTKPLQAPVSGFSVQVSKLQGTDHLLLTRH